MADLGVPGTQTWFQFWGEDTDLTPGLCSLLLDLQLPSAKPQCRQVLQLAFIPVLIFPSLSQASAFSFLEALNPLAKLTLLPPLGLCY